MEYLLDYLLFLAQAVTVVVAVLVVLSGVASVSARFQGAERGGHLEVKKLNDRLEELKSGLQQALLDSSTYKKQRKRDAKAAKQRAKVERAEAAKADSEHRKRVFVLDFHGDLQASAVHDLTTELTAVLTLADDRDEIVVKVESPGGLVHGYGLAASQLDRVREHGVPLVVAVDKVAASGGYLMAAVADRVVAAPFAVVGSIGVVAQGPNVHRRLKKHDVDVEVLTAGKFKRTLTVLGENTEEGRKKFIEDLEDTHALFQEFVAARRPQLDMATVATGETWHGQRAMDLKLVDELCTSDEYLVRSCETADVFSVRWVEHKKPLERIMAKVETGVQNIVDQLFRRPGP